MYFNFEGAFKVLGEQGDTIFRYDDTNPEAESQEYIDNIADEHRRGRASDSRDSRAPRPCFRQ